MDTPDSSNIDADSSGADAGADEVRPSEKFRRIPSGTTIKDADARKLDGLTRAYGAAGSGAYEDRLLLELLRRRIAERSTSITNLRARLVEAKAEQNRLERAKARTVASMTDLKEQTAIAKEGEAREDAMMEEKLDDHATLAKRAHRLKLLLQEKRTALQAAADSEQRLTQAARRHEGKMLKISGDTPEHAVERRELMHRLAEAGRHCVAQKRRLDDLDAQHQRDALAARAATQAARAKVEVADAEEKEAIEMHAVAIRKRDWLIGTVNKAKENASRSRSELAAKISAHEDRLVALMREAEERDAALREEEGEVGSQGTRSKVASADMESSMERQRALRDLVGERQAELADLRRSLADAENSTSMLQKELEIERERTIILRDQMAQNQHNVDAENKEIHAAEAKVRMLEAQIAEVCEVGSTRRMQREGADLDQARLEKKEREVDDRAESAKSQLDEQIVNNQMLEERLQECDDACAKLKRLVEDALADSEAARDTLARRTGEWQQARRATEVYLAKMERVSADQEAAQEKLEASIKETDHNGRTVEQALEVCRGQNSEGLADLAIILEEKKKSNTELESVAWDRGMQVDEVRRKAKEAASEARIIQGKVLAKEAELQSISCLLREEEARVEAALSAVSQKASEARTEWEKASAELRNVTAKATRMSEESRAARARANTGERKCTDIRSQIDAFEVLKDEVFARGEALDEELTVREKELKEAIATNTSLSRQVEQAADRTAFVGDVLKDCQGRASDERASREAARLRKKELGQTLLRQKAKFADTIMAWRQETMSLKSQLIDSDASLGTLEGKLAAELEVGDRLGYYVDTVHVTQSEDKMNFHNMRMQCRDATIELHSQHNELATKLASMKLQLDRNQKALKRKELDCSGEARKQDMLKYNSKLRREESRVLQAKAGFLSEDISIAQKQRKMLDQEISLLKSEVTSKDALVKSLSLEVEEAKQNKHRLEAEIRMAETRESALVMKIQETRMKFSEVADQAEIKMIALRSSKEKRHEQELFERMNATAGRGSGRGSGSGAV